MEALTLSARIALLEGDPQAALDLVDRVTALSAALEGLEVEIRQGGPQVNHSQLLAAGRLAPAAIAVVETHDGRRAELAAAHPGITVLAEPVPFSVIVPRYSAPVLSITVTRWPAARRSGTSVDPR